MSPGGFLSETSQVTTSWASTAWGDNPVCIVWIAMVNRYLI